MGRGIKGALRPKTGVLSLPPRALMEGRSGMVDQRLRQWLSAVSGPHLEGPAHPVGARGALLSAADPFGTQVFAPARHLAPRPQAG